MKTEFDDLDKDEKLKAENDFLKMKIMLEHGAHFGTMEGSASKLKPGIENQFLKNVMAFEREFAKEQKLILVFDKIGCPAQFKPVNEIPDEEIETAWEQLEEYLRNRQICIGVISPKVTTREIYRFTVEELFQKEMDDMHLPGFNTHFTYDEFYPDQEYENTNIAMNECIRDILLKRPLEWLTNYGKNNLQLNTYEALTENEFKLKVNHFKNAYDDISDAELGEIDCKLDDKQCRVTGTFSTTAILQQEKIPLSGAWVVEFYWDSEIGYWLINNVQIDGIKF